MTPRQRGRKWMERRARWLAEHPLCAYCAQKNPPGVTAAEEVDHVVPLFKGGADDESNFVSTCRDCHKDKTARDLGHQPRRRIGLDGYPL